MLVFIDESGDPGFRLDKASSPLFVVAKVVFASAEDARATSELIARSQARRMHKSESSSLIPAARSVIATSKISRAERSPFARPS
jgi:hypothetical protein